MMSEKSVLSLELTAAEAERAERRHSLRKVLHVRAQIVPDGDEPLGVHTIDLSHEGVSITSDRPLNIGQECSVELGISIPKLASPPGLRAGVRYCAQLSGGQYRIGMKFTWVSIEAAELLAAVLT